MKDISALRTQSCRFGASPGMLFSPPPARVPNVLFPAGGSDRNAAGIKEEEKGLGTIVLGQDQKRCLYALTRWIGAHDQP